MFDFSASEAARPETIDMDTEDEAELHVNMHQNVRFVEFSKLQLKRLTKVYGRFGPATADSRFV